MGWITLSFFLHMLQQCENEKAEPQWPKGLRHHYLADCFNSSRWWLQPCLCQNPLSINVQRISGSQHFNYTGYGPIMNGGVTTHPDAALQIFSPWKLRGLGITGSLQGKPALSLEKGCKNHKETLCMLWINPVIFTDCREILWFSWGFYAICKYYMVYPQHT